MTNKKTLLNQNGFSLMEAIIAVAVSITFIFIAQSALVSYLQQQKQQEKVIMSKILINQVIADLSINWIKYPVLYVDGALGTYIQCYDKALTLVSVAGVPSTTIKKTSLLIAMDGRPITQCPSTYEIRTEASNIGVQTIFKVSILTPDINEPTVSVVKAHVDLYHSQGQ